MGYVKKLLRKNAVVTAAVGIIAAGFLISYFGPSLARADVFRGIWRNFIAPFSAETSTLPFFGREKAGDEGREVSLYKPVQDYEKAVISAVRNVSPAVISITVSKNVPIIEQCPYNPFGDLPRQLQPFFGDQFLFSVPCERGEELREVGNGSGFVISPDGLIVTNKHVVSDQEASYTVFTNDGKKYDAEVLARDPSQDLAVVKISASGLPAAELGDSDELELGQTAIAIGNALGEFRNTVSVGVVSGLARNVTASGPGVTEVIRGVIQTDAAINPGNSGGPLVNLRGEVVGISTAVARGAENIGFAIPVNDVKRAIESVRETGEIRVAFLGVRYFMVTPELKEAQSLPVDYGALLRGTAGGPAVIPGSPAAEAGLRAEDVILEIDGRRIDPENPLGAAISRRDVGEKIALKVLRGGEEILLEAILAQRKGE